MLLACRRGWYEAQMSMLAQDQSAGVKKYLDVRVAGLPGRGVRGTHIHSGLSKGSAGGPGGGAGQVCAHDVRLYAHILDKPPPPFPTPRGLNLRGPLIKALQIPHLASACPPTHILPLPPLTSFCLSFSRSTSSEAACDSRSEPARSTRLITEMVTGPRGSSVVAGGGDGAVAVMPPPSDSADISPSDSVTV